MAVTSTSRDSRWSGTVHRTLASITEVHPCASLKHHIPASQGCINSNGGAGIDHSNYSSRDNDTLRNLVYDIGPFSLQDGGPAAAAGATVQGIYHANLRGSRTVIYDLNKDGQVNELDRHVLENVLLGRATCP